jgi:hypothetical protein
MCEIKKEFRKVLAAAFSPISIAVIDITEQLEGKETLVPCRSVTTWHCMSSTIQNTSMTFLTSNFDDDDQKKKIIIDSLIAEVEAP